jgi:hypothetical protein
LCPWRAGSGGTRQDEKGFDKTNIPSNSTGLRRKPAPRLNL